MKQTIEMNRIITVCVCVVSSMLFEFEFQLIKWYEIMSEAKTMEVRRKERVCVYVCGRESDMNDKMEILYVCARKRERMGTVERAGVG